jgi:hypothetical protein
MQITEQTTVKTVVEAYPRALDVFLRHGVDVPSECDETNILACSHSYEGCRPGRTSTTILTASHSAKILKAGLIESYNWR